MSKTILIGAASAALIAGVAAASVNKATDVACHIRTERHGNVLSLEGIAAADRSISGTYQLNVQKSGGDGDSSVSQGGAFSAMPNRQAVLGSTALNLYPQAQFSAHMTLSWNGGDTSCQAGS
jgi:curli production assembly/transport CsgH protein